MNLRVNVNELLGGNSMCWKILSSIDVSWRLLCTCASCWHLGSSLRGTVNPPKECQLLEQKHCVHMMQSVDLVQTHFAGLNLFNMLWIESSVLREITASQGWAVLLLLVCSEHPGVCRSVMMFTHLIFTLLDAPAMPGFNFVTVRPSLLIYSQI